MGYSKYNFCTLFDSYYLAKGLVLYNSLERHCDNFHLFIFAFNEKCRFFLENKNLKHATIISLEQFEDPELLNVKPKRTIAEYCWTATSSTVLYCLNNFEIDSCTYVDADLCFYSSPKLIFDEIGIASIAFTRHNYHFLYDHSKTNGEYCVQFMYFRNDDNSKAALKWWRDKCLEWCYSYLEDGKFGDQGYLPELIGKFNNVYIIKNEGAGMAPWNLLRYKKISGTQNKYIIKSTKEEFELIFYHYHYLHYKIDSNTIKANPGRVFFNRNILQNYYLPYLTEICKHEKEIQLLNTENIDCSNVILIKTLLFNKIMIVFRVLLKRNKFVRIIYNKFTVKK
jgi:hypothetical protein